MSWQDYVDNQLTGTGHCTKGAIIGPGGAVWALSNGFGMAKGLWQLYEKPESAFMSGIQLDEGHLITIKSDGRSLYGKRGAGGVSCAKTNTLIIVGVYDEAIQPANNAVVVERLADYLIDNGY